MVTVNLARAKARLSELLEKGEAAQEAVITRGGAVAHISPVLGPRKSLPLLGLAAFRAGMPRLRRPVAELLRDIRNEAL